MISLPLSGFSKARVWRDEAIDGLGLNRVGIGVEILIPRGAMAEYGLLGMSIAPEGVSDVRMAVPTAGEEWPSSLASRIDTVRACLPIEFARPVVSEAERIARQRGIGIVIECGCYGEAGSNVRLLTNLARVCVELLADSELRFNDLELKNVLEGVR